MQTKIQSKRKSFTAVKGEENSLTINYTYGSDGFQVGFISDTGNFYFDTIGEQVSVSLTDLDELSQFINSLIK